MGLSTFGLDYTCLELFKDLTAISGIVHVRMTFGITTTLILRATVSVLYYPLINDEI